MSAQALLSVLAPSIPSAPQGSAGEAASGFQALLAALTADTGAEGDASTVVPPPVEGSGAVDPVAAGFLAAPPLLAGPLVIPAPAPEGEPAAGSSAPTSASGEGPAADTVPHGTTPLPVDKVAPPKESDPPVQPVEPGSRTLARGATGDTPLTLAETAAATEAAEARARIAGAFAAPSPLPQPQLHAPLRPLAERTSRPVDPATTRSAETPAADATRSSAAATAAPPTARPDRPIDPQTFAAVLAADTAAASDVEDRAAERPPTAETLSAPSSPAANVRDFSLSTLSRATIDATAQIAAQILRRLEGRSTRFEMALTPDDLGRVDVKLDIDSEGRLNARLAFDNPLAATDMKGRVDDLRRQLEDAGFHLADDAFEFTDRDSGSSAFDRGQSARDGQSRAFAAAARLNADIDLAQPPRWLSLSLSPSGVDIKV